MADVEVFAAEPVPVAPPAAAEREEAPVAAVPPARTAGKRAPPAPAPAAAGIYVLRVPRPPVEEGASAAADEASKRLATADAKLATAVAALAAAQARARTAAGAGATRRGMPAAPMRSRCGPSGRSGAACGLLATARGA